MNALDRAERYLTIPPRYGAELGGLWWSSRHDAIERRDGTTLAVADEVRAVLEGALSHPAAPAFAFVLNLLHRMKTGGEPTFEPLHQAYTATRGVASRGRNVGLFIARLCDDLPWVPGAITFEDVSTALRSLRLYGSHTRPDGVDEPPLTRAEFEQHVAGRLTRYSEAALVHWLTYGQSPGAGGAKVAEQAETLPERVTRLLGIARKRARLVGAASLVPALDAALALPPRGRPPEALPVGGYCDVTTRGGPERLLPGQFALDPDEFVRRFAAHELLYFKREEPHAAVRPNRVVVLDQGVRTWGSVRLALAAAALSLIKVDPKRCGTAQLFTTSNGMAVHLLHPNLDRLADRLEASDLTPHPAACLSRALDAGEGEPRDIILLTHPRSLREPEVLQIAEDRSPNDRLFAVTVDESGRAQLVQWGPGGAVTVRAFKIDLEAAEAARPEGDAPAPQPRPQPALATTPWSGDVEPVPFPFRPGVVSEPVHFGFQADIGWLAAAGKDGVVHSLAFDGTPPEVLPRAFRNGAVLRQVDAVLGVTGGFVVCGRMVVGSAPTVAAQAPRAVTISVNNTLTFASTAPPAPVAEQFVAAHYDRATRHVTLHILGPAKGDPWWSAHPELHCVAVRTGKGDGCALDLGTLGRFPYPRAPAPALISRACLAWDRAATGTPPHELPVVPKLPSDNRPVWAHPFLLVSRDGTVHLQQPGSSWQPTIPTRDGKPLLADADPRRAELAALTLALSYASQGKSNLLLLRGPDGAVLGEVEHSLRNAFGLSASGLLLARCDTTHGIIASRAADPSRAIGTAPHAALHNGLLIELDANPFHLRITIGAYRHGFRIENGELMYRSRWEVTEPVLAPEALVRHDPTTYDPARFSMRDTVRTGGWVAVLDRLGQVLLYRGENGPLVAVFLVRRERAAAWIPAGAFWGDARLIGGPATPDAGKKIGQAIIDAEGDRGSAVPAGPA